MAVLSNSHSQTAQTPAQRKQNGDEGLATGSRNLIEVWGYVFAGKSIHGTNFTSSLNTKTLKNVSLCMSVWIFPTNVSHKENVEYGPLEPFPIPFPFWLSAENISAASKLRVNQYIFISGFPTIRGGLKIWSAIKKISHFKLLLWIVYPQNGLNKSLTRSFSKFTIGGINNIVFKVHMTHFFKENNWLKISNSS